MPLFYEEVDLDISVDEFISECSDVEINQIIDILKNKKKIAIEKLFDHPSLNEIIHVESCKKLFNSYHRLSTEDCETLYNISNKL